MKKKTGHSSRNRSQL